MPDPDSTRPRTFAALADNADYRRFYFGQGVSLLGTWMQEAAVSWVVYDLTRSEWALGLVSAAGTMPGLAVGLLAGALADRVASRAMILRMQVGQMVLAFLLAALVGSGAARVWQMALILAAARVCVTFEMPSRQVFLYELVGRSALMNAIALNSGLFNASRVVGPALAGLCLARLGTTTPFLLNGFSYLAAIGTLLTIRVGRAPRDLKGPGQAFEGIAYLKRDRRVRRLFLLMIGFGVVGMGYSAMVPAYARRVIGTEELGYSLLLSCGGLGATAGALLVASLSSLRARERLIPLGIAIFAASLAWAGSVPAYLARLGLSEAALSTAALGLFGTGFGAIIYYAVTQTMIQTSVPDALRGRVMGVWMIVFSGSVPLGSLAAGLIARRFGVTTVMEVSAAACLAMAITVATLGRRR